ncbi:geranylgeranyl pyrophosphate synthetase [Capsaspora owczarzaki ATCC 30864]|uniref:Geranylgeranyl pyrophosphate synthetase n=1 Tax=Capsaspora owczarzaki (strain ATCC 30864) TaxID=595528 RepID=A0A0D2WNC8_CAPO3|nr:geranylgeranyl pyrophosphate synthetase [Capsaspora owczarzaki ATCC 30864]KJE91883.1 geranylgeranyl pyrophosphate synthetase [Capsaspora owczarzaki ATCC 30864]|eukprot:XP_004363786.1 geranylgeranyl pyrophosphate synthetase [Capsaspora owczarzaki ATCC 30864]
MTSEQQQKTLLEPYTYLTSVPGKEVRTILIRAFDQWMHIPTKELDEIKGIVQMLHSASLLIDDIEDNSKLRRGVPVAHLIYGVPSTINCANYAYFLALERVLKLNKPEAVAAFTEELLELHRGQGLDIWWRDSNVCPTEEEYREMVKRKTGGLFRLSVRLMQAFSENRSNFVPLLDALGLYFQIRDDFANLESKEYTDNKSFCEDLTEGKFSFPIIHSILSAPSQRQLLNILKQRTTDIDMKKFCLETMRKTGSFEYTIKVLNELEQEALSEIAKLGGNQMLTDLIAELRKVYSTEQHNPPPSPMPQLAQTKPF